MVARKTPGKSRRLSAVKYAPTASRPVMPAVYGIPKAMEGSLNWVWANQRLTDSHNYLITTVRPDSRPHTMVMHGIWFNNAYYFSTGASTRKAKNLAANPNCVVCNEDVEEAVIVEGKATQLSVEQIPEPAFALYKKKYGWKLDPEMGPVFKVSPHVVFAMPEKLFPAGATRWVFE
jgi:nitroimidazol reductase NimA-like FMN-containing flavoprotein (pyridoxamine 5'-phosphate oxidase superfamily)